MVIPLFDEISPGYIVASRPFKSKEELEQYIQEFRPNTTYTPYHCQEDDSWYILEEQKK